jgi:hypothetical protein
MGASVSGPMILTWATDNAAPDTMRAVVTAAIPGIGAIGSILAFVVLSLRPVYTPDHAWLTGYGRFFRRTHQTTAKATRLI